MVSTARFGLTISTQLIIACPVSLTSYLQTIYYNYICRIDVLPTDNSLMHAEVTSPTTLTSSLISFLNDGVEIKVCHIIIRRGVKCVDLKRQGLAKVEHKPPIYEDDLKKL